MRVAILVDRFPTISETFVTNQLGGLLERGWEVHIVSLYGSENRVDLPSDLPGGLRVHYPAGFGEPYGVRFAALMRRYWRATAPERLVMRRALDVFRYRRASVNLRTAGEASACLSVGRCDVVYAQFGWLGLKALDLRRLGALPGPLLTHFRGYDLTAYLKTHGPSAYGSLFRDGQHFLAVSEDFRQRLLALGCPEDQTQVLRSGIDLERFRYRPIRPPERTERLELVSAGRFVQKKGFEYAIRAVRLLADHEPDVRYRLAGTGPLRSSLERLVEELGLRRHVEFVGALPPDGIEELMRESHIAVVSSVTADNGDQEGIPNVLKESMALGLPVVATRHSGIPELVTHGESGFLVPEKDPDAIAACIRHLHQNPHDWNRLGRAAAERVRTDYDRSLINDQLDRVLAHVSGLDL
jgi:colanic acid/amylovoran biosynthesis glycosyltransferase